MAETALDLSNRDRVLAALEDESFDILVIGGGITGAGIARDAALRGLRTALIEARDFASGTSSRSTKLIHGGLRYLAQGDIGLVREAARERTILQHIAPHLAVKTPMVLPARTRADLVLRRAALIAYERLGQVPREDRFEVWNTERLRSEEPLLRSDDLAGAVVYSEYLTDDARLVIANIRSAAAAGAIVVNYLAAEGFLTEAKRLAGVVAREMLPRGHRQVRVRARLIVNAAGPWVDAVRRLNDPGASTKLTLTQGIHLVLPRERLPVTRVVLTNAADGRGVFAVPRGDYTYVGTTDTLFPAPDYWPHIAEREIGYLLSAINASFTIDTVSTGSVVAFWSGLRPLIAQPGKGPTQISRKDEIFEDSSGLVTIAGGKLTQYRKMAEKVVDLGLRRLGRAAVRSKTMEQPLPGADLTVEPLMARLQLLGANRAGAARLARLYGSEAEAIQMSGGNAQDEARHAVICEGAVMLEDYWVRRSARAWFPTGEENALATAAAAMAPLLGWSREETERQIAACRSIAGVAQR